MVCMQMSCAMFGRHRQGKASMTTLATASLMTTFIQRNFQGMPLPLPLPLRRGQNTPGAICRVIRAKYGGILMGAAESWQQEEASVREEVGSLGASEGIRAVRLGASEGIRAVRLGGSS